MSRKTFLEALEGVLRREMELREDVMVLRPGAKQALEADERDIALPDLGDAAFSAAAGAAMCGMRPVLDLRHTPDAAAVLLDSVSALTPGFMPDMTILTGAEDAELLMELPGLRVFYPQTPRQAAGFIRAALRGERICLLIADEELADMEDDVPDDDDFMLMPLSAADPMNEADEEADEDVPVEEEYTDPDEEASGEEEYIWIDEAATEDISDEECAGADGDASGEEERVWTDEAAPEESTGEACVDIDEDISEEAECVDTDGDDSEEAECAGADEDAFEEAACAGMDEETSVRRAGVCRPAMRSVPWNAGRLRSLAEELDMDEERLAARCMERVAGKGSVEWTYEADSLSGECAFLPAQDGQAHLWIGCDRLCLTWDAEALTGRDAAGILRAAMRMLEKPTLLIYDKEDQAE